MRAFVDSHGQSAPAVPVTQIRTYVHGQKLSRRGDRDATRRRIWRTTAGAAVIDRYVRGLLLV